jgi:hypothetical protein
MKIHNKQNLLDKYDDIWNSSLKELQSDFDKDKEEFKNDENIGFKWNHLMRQEILMWIDQCCGNVVAWDQIPIDDFKFIINRRGFTPRIIENLKNILKKIGIGEKI